MFHLLQDQRYIFKFLCFFDGIIFPSEPKWFRLHEVLHISEILVVGIIAILLEKNFKTHQKMFNNSKSLLLIVGVLCIRKWDFKKTLVRIIRRKI